MDNFMTNAGGSVAGTSDGAFERFVTAAIATIITIMFSWRLLGEISESEYEEKKREVEALGQRQLYQSKCSGNVGTACEQDIHKSNLPGLSDLTADGYNSTSDSNVKNVMRTLASHCELFPDEKSAAEHTCISFDNHPGSPKNESNDELYIREMEIPIESENSVLCSSPINREYRDIVDDDTYIDYTTDSGVSLGSFSCGGMDHGEANVIDSDDEDFYSGSRSFLEPIMEEDSDDMRSSSSDDSFEYVPAANGENANERPYTPTFEFDDSDSDTSEGSYYTHEKDSVDLFELKEESFPDDLPEEDCVSSETISNIVHILPVEAEIKTNALCNIGGQDDDTFSECSSSGDSVITVVSMRGLETGIASENGRPRSLDDMVLNSNYRDQLFTQPEYFGGESQNSVSAMLEALHLRGVGAHPSGCQDIYRSRSNLNEDIDSEVDSSVMSMSEIKANLKQSNIPDYWMNKRDKLNSSTVNQDSDDSGAPVFRDAGKSSAVETSPVGFTFSRTEEVMREYRTRNYVQDRNLQSEYEHFRVDENISDGSLSSDDSEFILVNGRRYSVEKIDDISKKNILPNSNKSYPDNNVNMTEFQKQMELKNVKNSVERANSSFSKTHVPSVTEIIPRESIQSYSGSTVPIKDISVINTTNGAESAGIYQDVNSNITPVSSDVQQKYEMCDATYKSPGEHNDLTPQIPSQQSNNNKKLTTRASTAETRDNSLPFNEDQTCSRNIVENSILADKSPIVRFPNGNGQKSAPVHTTSPECHTVLSPRRETEQNDTQVTSVHSKSSVLVKQKAVVDHQDRYVPPSDEITEECNILKAEQISSLEHCRPPNTMARISAIHPAVDTSHAGERNVTIETPSRSVSGTSKLEVYDSSMRTPDVTKDIRNDESFQSSTTKILKDVENLILNREGKTSDDGNEANDNCDKALLDDNNNKSNLPIADQAIVKRPSDFSGVNKKARSHNKHYSSVLLEPIPADTEDTRVVLEDQIFSPSRHTVHNNRDRFLSEGNNSDEHFSNMFFHHKESLVQQAMRTRKRIRRTSSSDSDCSSSSPLNTSFSSVGHISELYSPSYFERSPVKPHLASLHENCIFSPDRQQEIINRTISLENMNRSPFTLESVASFVESDTEPCDITERSINETDLDFSFRFQQLLDLERALSMTELNLSQPPRRSSGRGRFANRLSSTVKSKSMQALETNLDDDVGSDIGGFGGLTRAPSVHELRVSRSLSRLNVPDWYKSSEISRSPSCMSILRRDSQTSLCSYSVPPSGLSSPCTSISSNAAPVVIKTRVSPSSAKLSRTPKFSSTLERTPEKAPLATPSCLPSDKYRQKEKSSNLMPIPIVPFNRLRAMFEKPKSPAGNSKKRSTDKMFSKTLIISPTAKDNSKEETIQKSVSSDLSHSPAAQTVVVKRVDKTEDKTDDGSAIQRNNNFSHVNVTEKKDAMRNGNHNVSKPKVPPKPVSGVDEPRTEAKGRIELDKIVQTPSSDDDRKASVQKYHELKKQIDSNKSTEEKVETKEKKMNPVRSFFSRQAQNSSFFSAPIGRPIQSSGLILGNKKGKNDSLDSIKDSQDGSLVNENSETDVLFNYLQKQQYNQKSQPEVVVINGSDDDEGSKHSASNANATEHSTVGESVNDSSFYKHANGVPTFNKALSGNGPFTNKAKSEFCACNVDRNNRSLETTCMNVLYDISDNMGMLLYLSKLAINKNATCGRGVVVLAFKDLTNAQDCLTYGTNSSYFSPAYLSSSDLDFLLSSVSAFGELTDVCASYNPDTSFIFCVLIACGLCCYCNSQPAGCANVCDGLAFTSSKFRLMPSAVYDVDDSLVKRILIILLPSGAKDREYRERYLVNVHRKLRTHGISLRHRCPDIYAKLIDFVAEGGTVGTLLFSPNESAGKTETCVITPEVTFEPDILCTCITDHTQARPSVPRHRPAFQQPKLTPKFETTV